jgi:hypothetical protein
MEYYQTLSLVRVINESGEDDQIDTGNRLVVDPNGDPFLHAKHMERDFLIFKEVSFSKRGVKNTN